MASLGVLGTAGLVVRQRAGAGPFGIARTSGLENVYSGGGH